MADVNNIDYIDEPVYEIPFSEVQYQLNNIEFVEEEENPGGGQEPGFNPGFN